MPEWGQDFKAEADTDLLPAVSAQEVLTTAASQNMAILPPLLHIPKAYQIQ